MRTKFNVRRIYTLLMLGLMCLCSGCVIGQQWSENYALQPGVTASDPTFIDGKPETIGQSQRKKSSGSALTDLNIPSEAIIHLPEKRSIYRIVIHSTNLEDFEVQAFDSLGEWQKIYDRRTNKDRVIDIRLNKFVTTTGIKLLVRRTTDDAAQRRENLKLKRENVETSDGKRRRGRYLYHLTGPTTALAKISEIELYGYAD
ncbi:hypothetical protein F4009_18100 [Candidatus Poribacteria bacterium]|nr:hypothetical protein [Candidatus Poribacteria bacterium]MYH80915.1 hypothetical protein [Candidatus Poribacteria bacterium]MYK95881.1 hypothetical protein [Candidatus Poribacteria bacterium]